MNIRIALRMVRTLPLFVFAATAIQAQAQTYNLTLLDGSDAGVNINNSGQVVVTSGFINAGIWSNGQTTPLDTMGVRFQLPYEINNGGEVIGDAMRVLGRGTGALWNANGQGQLLTMPSYDYTTAQGINDAHVVVGSATDVLRMRAVVWQNGTGSLLAGLPMTLITSSSATDINNDGQVVGYTFSGGFAHAVIWHDIHSDAALLPALAGTNQSQATFINDAGQAIGTSQLVTVTNGANTPGKRIATLWSGGTAIELHNLADATGDTDVAGINIQGMAVGTSWIASASSNQHGIATLWSPDGQSAVDLNTLLDPKDAKSGWVLQAAYDINDQGMIVGQAFNSITSETTGFLLTPVPEPTTAIYFALGLLGTACAVRRRYKRHHKDQTDRRA
ncbi:MAG: hypothetical protein EKK47_08725 [Burkholderiales bacterium]|nr:MAG: hypothetical protein EKK47_08725 [Burkholderiales bacterium]